MRLLDRLTSAARHPVSQNALALYALQGVLSVLPLITLPWLARALGPSELGIVLFVQSFSWLLGNLVEYGFGLSASREAARQRDRPEAMAQTAAGVIGARGLLIGVASTLSASTLLFVPYFRDDPWLLAFGWAMAVLHGLNPAWFFIGVERLRFLAGVEVAIRLLTAVALIALVRDTDDGWRVLAIWTTASALSVCVLLTAMYRQVALVRSTWADSVAQLRRSWALFVSFLGVTLYTSGTVFLLGLVVSSAQTALFGAAERLVRAALRGAEPIVTAAYPRVNMLLEQGQPERANRLARITLWAQLALGSIGAALLIVLAPWIVRTVLGDGYEGSVPLLRVLALMIPVVGVGATFSRHWLIPRGLDLAATAVVVGVGLVSVVLTLVVGSTAGAYGVAWTLVGVETAITVGYALVMRREGLALRGPTTSGRSRA